MKKGIKMTVVVILSLVLVGMYFFKNSNLGASSDDVSKELYTVPKEVITKVINNEPLEKPVFIEFSSTTWPACRRMEPVMKDIFKEYGEKVDIGILNIDRSTSDEVVKLANKFKVMAIPHFILIDKDGTVKNNSVGIMSKSEIESLFEEINIQK